MSSDQTHPDLPTFFNACEGGHEATVRLLLHDEKKPIQVNSTDTYGNTPLHAASKSGRTLIVRILLAQGAAVNATNNYSETALHSAAMDGHADTIKVLLQEGNADPFLADMFGVLPIHVAAKKGHKDAVKAFVAVSGMDPLIQDKRGNTPQSLADDGRYFELQSYMKIAVKKWNKKKAAEAAATATTTTTAPAAVAGEPPKEISSATTEPTRTTTGTEPSKTVASLSNHQSSHLNALTAGDLNKCSSENGMFENTHHEKYHHESFHHGDLSSPNASSNSSPSNNVNAAAAVAVSSSSQEPSNKNTLFSTSPPSISANNNNNSIANDNKSPTTNNNNNLLASSSSSVSVSNNSSPGSQSFSSTSSMFMMSNGNVSDESQHQLNAAVESLKAKIIDNFPSFYIIQFNDIRLEKRLGAGGGGSVFRAMIKSCHRPVAAKLFREADVAVDQAIQECKIAMQLHHKNIIQLVGITVVGNLFPMPCAEIMMLQELGEGTLQGLLSDHKSSKHHHHHSFETLFPWEKVLRYSFQIASALDYLHNVAKMNHLDLKPANVLFDSNHVIKLCDFGLTRAMRMEMTHVDVSRVNLGTCRWMSPEQAISNRIAPTNDIYSWGAILYNMINKGGKEPWHDRDAKEISKLISSPSFYEESNQKDPLLQGLAERIDPREGCPQFLVDLCKSSLQIDYTKRPKHGGELVEQMRNATRHLLESDPAFSHAAGDLTYMGLEESDKLRDDDSIQASGSASQYVPEVTEVIEGAGYDDDY